MKLITEYREDGFETTTITEEKNGEKQHYIKGIFMQAEVVNRNKRIYPIENLAKEVERYNKEYIQKNGAYGELGHPKGPNINLDRASHLIKELKQDGNDFMGKAKIINTPNGNIVKSLIDEGARIGVSSRGMGSIIKSTKRNVDVIHDDFHLITAADIVADPSAPDAFVNGIMENKEWVWDNGVWMESELERIKKEIEKGSSKEIEEIITKSFRQLMESM